MAEGTRMQQRRATAAVWNTSGYVLSSGELGVTTDTGIIKIGNGTSAWTDLPVAFSSDYLPILGTAANSELLDGIDSSGFLKPSDAAAAATASKLIMRDASGKAKAVAGTASDDLVNFAQMNTADTTAIASAISGTITPAIAASSAAAIVTGNQETIIRTVTANTTVAATDIRSLLVVSNASYTPSLTVTIPPNASVAIPVGSWFDLFTTGIGPATLTPGAGVTIRGVTVIYGGYSTCRCLKIATDEWAVLRVKFSPGPVLRRIYRAAYSLPNGAHTAVPLDGVDTSIDGPTKNQDTLGANQQWTSGNVTRAICCRSGWYSFNSQFNCGTGPAAARGFADVWVNGTQQYSGRGGPRTTTGETTFGTSGYLPLNVGDYMESGGYQDTGGALAIGGSGYSASFFEWRWDRPL